MILVYTPQITNRVEYIFTQVLVHILGFEIRLTDSLPEAKVTTFPVINYSETTIEKAIQVKPAGLLTKKGIDESLQPKLMIGKKRKILFCTNHKTLDFDLFSAAFYLITRYEEYVVRETDKHGRFQAKNSLAYKSGFLLEPIIDQWAYDFKVEILTKYPDTPCVPPLFRFVPTIDIDNSFAYRHKGLITNGYGLLRELFLCEFKRAWQRIKVVCRVEKDPFFRYHFMAEVHNHYNTSPIYFFHEGDYGRYDKKTLFHRLSLSYKKQKKKLLRTDVVGIHLSYKAAFNKRQMQKEIGRLEKLSNKKTALNRFHYIRFRLPESYQTLSKLGITKDYSMGYSTDLGFRASTSIPFSFYCLESDKSLSITIFPFVMMDRTMKDFLKLKRRETVAFAKILADKIAAVNGHFITIFHNEAFSQLSEWEGYRRVYRAILRYGSDLEKGLNKERKNQ